MPGGRLAGPQVQAQGMSFRCGGVCMGQSQQDEHRCGQGVWAVIFILKHHFVVVILLY